MKLYKLNKKLWTDATVEEIDSVIPSNMETLICSSSGCGGGGGGCGGGCCGCGCCCLTLCMVLMC